MAPIRSENDRFFFAQFGEPAKGMIVDFHVLMLI
jgi:hypothetical protein